MDVLSTDELDHVAGGFLPFTIFGIMYMNLDLLTATVTGAVDGFMDGFRRNRPDNTANPNY